MENEDEQAFQKQGARVKLSWEAERQRAWFNVVVERKIEDSTSLGTLGPISARDALLQRAARHSTAN